MRILWITNLLFPEAQILLTRQGELKSSGGWMTASAETLLRTPGINLTIATVSHLVKHLTEIQGQNIKYFILPYGQGNKIYNKEYEPYFKRIYNSSQPDVVHIHGTEFTQGLAYVNACGNRNVIVSIQGMKSVIANYYCAGISLWERIRYITFRDLFKGGIGYEAKAYAKQGKNEIELLRKVNHVIGRTSWDRAHAWIINNDITYHHCNETLRPEFYQSNKWDYKKCQKHSIFLSQAWYPLKGAHQVFKAISYLIDQYPDIEIRIAGNDITQYASFRGIAHYSTYGRYLKHLISKTGLAHKITFLGSLSTQNMIDEYLRCNVFICPSSIENSPNSLGEAQILGTPCIASYAGGIPDLMKGDEEHLFRFEDIEMLADCIHKVFDSTDTQVSMIASAMERHDPERNRKQLLDIYNLIIGA